MKKILIILLLIFLMSFMIGCNCNTDYKSLKAQAELEETNLELVRQAWTDWNNRNLDFITDIDNPDDYAYYSPVGTSKPQSHEEVIGMIKALWAGFSDVTINPIDMIASLEIRLLQYTFLKEPTMENLMVSLQQVIKWKQE